MRNLITITLIALVTLASCQKDYYLEDLNSAQQEIAELRGALAQTQINLNSAEEVINTQAENLQALNTEIVNYIEVIDALELNNDEILAELGFTRDELDSVRAELVNEQGLVNDLEDEVIELRRHRNSLVLLLGQTNADNSNDTAQLQSEIDDLNNVINSIQAELDAERRNTAALMGSIERLNQQVREARGVDVDALEIDPTQFVRANGTSKVFVAVYQINENTVITLGSAGHWRAQTVNADGTLTKIGGAKSTYAEALALIG